jgi:hypothetical protein
MLIPRSLRISGRSGVRMFVAEMNAKVVRPSSRESIGMPAMSRVVPVTGS